MTDDQLKQMSDDSAEHAFRYEVKYTYASGKAFWAQVSFEDYEDSRMNGSPVRCVTPPCKGMNCGCTDGVNHSPECLAEHAATVAGNLPVENSPSCPQQATIEELIKGLEAEQTFISSSRERCDPDYELPRWDRIQRAIDAITAYQSLTARLISQRDAQEVLIGEHIAKQRKAEDGAEQWRKDAERYRCLKTFAHASYNVKAISNAESASLAKEEFLTVYVGSWEAMDAVIDAALAATEGEES